MKESKKLRRSLIVAALALLAALFSVSAATFAWYVFNTAAHTTEVKMSAGSSVSLEISNAADGEYGSATQMESFTGMLVPVSTDKITGGFQRVDKFITVKEGDTYRLIAHKFRPSVDEVDYFKTSLYLRTNSMNLGIYLSSVGFEDADEENPASTAMRVGLVVGEEEYIYEVNPAVNPATTWTDIPQDNASKHPEGGYVLRHDKTDGTETEFVPLTEDNFCNYDPATGTSSLKENSVRIGVISGDGKGGYGEPLKVDVYLWLEGCDRDCTLNLGGQTMELLALNFAGFSVSGG